jgi:Tfp pilus assembly protein PilN
MRAINLIPADQRSGQPVGAGRSQGGAYAVLVLVGGLALMAFLYGQAKHELTSRSGQVASLAAQAQQAQAAAERLSPYTSFIAMREQRMQAVDGLVDSRFDWAHALHEFGRVLPSQTSISSLSGTIGAAGASVSASAGGAASATPSGAVPTFALAGCATSQEEVALTLQRLRLMDGVKEVTLQNSTESSSTSSAGASSASGGCSGRDATFTASVIFDPLPSSTQVAAASRVVSNSTSAGSTSATPSTPGASEK